MKAFPIKFLIISLALHSTIISYFVFGIYPKQKAETSMLTTEIIMIKDSYEVKNHQKVKKAVIHINKRVKLNSPEKKIENKSVQNKKKEPKNILTKLKTSNLKEKEISKNTLKKSVSQNKVLNDPPNYGKKISKPQKSVNKEISKAVYKLGSINNPHPPYPIIARKKGLQGRLLLSVSVGLDGSVKSVSIMRSSGHLILDKVSKKTIQNWVFTPAEKEGVAVKGNVEVPIRFVLTD